VTRQPTRRELVKRGIAAGAAASLLAATSDAAAATSSDAQVLASALRVEQLLVVCYERVAATSVLSAPVRTEVEKLLSQERDHVHALERAASTLGSSVSVPTPSLQEAQAELAHYHVPWSLTRLRTQRACLKLLIDVESVAENTYFKTIGELADPMTIRTCAEIMGCEAQHWTVLSGILNHGEAAKAVPYPFVGGPG
jgi:Ferritin-like domain